MRPYRIHTLLDPQSLTGLPNHILPVIDMIKSKVLNRKEKGHSTRQQLLAGALADSESESKRGGKEVGR